MKNFALIGLAGFVAKKHVKCISQLKGNLVAALDKHDNVGFIDSFFPKCLFFKNEDKIYHWYKVKKITDILRKEGNKKKSFNYIDSEFKKIKEPSIKIIFDD